MFDKETVLCYLHSSKSFPDKQLVPIQLQDESKSQPNLTGWWSSWLVQQFSSKERRQREQFPWSHQPSATPTSHFAPVKAFKQHRCTQRVSGFVWQNQTSLVTELSMQMLPKISHIILEVTVKTCSTPFVSSWNTRRRRRRKVPPVKKTNPKPTQHRHSRCFYCWCDTICEMVGNCSQTHTTGMPYGEFVTSERDWKEGTSQCTSQRENKRAQGHPGLSYHPSTTENQPFMGFYVCKITICVRIKSETSTIFFCVYAMTRFLII